MTDRRHETMCEQMLASLQRTWSMLPEFHLLVDDRHGSVNIDRLRRSYGGPLSATSWPRVSALHQASHRPELVEFASGNLLGRKLAFIMASAESRRTLWIDNDILFFRDFIPLVRAQPEGVFIGATRDAIFGRTDRFCSYAPRLAQHLFQGRAEVPSINSGLCLACGDVYGTFGLAAPVKHTLATGETNYFTEQTVISWGALQSRGIIWDMDRVRLDDDDIYRLAPSREKPTYYARHYTGNIRHLFWRDAFHLRFSRKGGGSHVC